FNTLLKNNNYINKSIITGIHKLETERLFSILNNVKFYTNDYDNKYTEYFGIPDKHISEYYDNSILSQIKSHSSVNVNKNNFYNFYNFYKNEFNTHDYANFKANHLNLTNIFNRAIDSV